MAVTPIDYVRKTGDIQVVLFDTSSAETMEDVRDWVVANLPAETEVTLRTSMGGLLFWPGITLRPGDLVAKGADNKLYKLTYDQLAAFFDPAV